MSSIAASALGGLAVPAAGKDLSVGNVTQAARISEKSIELTVCSQFGALIGKRMVWFGLTQAQERQFGFDAATDLGGKAFILQFKASSTVPRSGGYAQKRRFVCQHAQMVELVNRFGNLPNSCFYFLPNIGLFDELVAVSGNLINHSYLVDVAGIQKPVPPSGRQSDYHYVYLDIKIPSVTITSEPFTVKTVFGAPEFVRRILSSNYEDLPRSKDLLRFARTKLDERDAHLADLFFKNAALVVLPESG
jgi:hypothetical protein